jgi:hypothetical protein
MCHWNTGVMVADNAETLFPAAIVIYNINNVCALFLINFVILMDKSTQKNIQKQ